MQKALSLVQDDILGGALPPKTISKFFPRYRWRHRPKEE